MNFLLLYSIIPNRKDITMAITFVAEPVSIQFVLDVFKNLVHSELRKNINKASLEKYAGHQDGLIKCMALLFGESSDATALKAHQAGESWLQLAEKITYEKLNHWVDAFTDIEDIFELDFGACEEAVSDAVVEYAKENITQLIRSLQTSI